MNGTTLWQTISFYVWIKCFIMTLNMHLYIISTGWYTKTIYIEHGLDYSTSRETFIVAPPTNDRAVYLKR